MGVSTTSPHELTNLNLPFSLKIKYLGCTSPIKSYNNRTNLIIFIVFIFADLLGVKICLGLSPKFFMYVNRHLSLSHWPFYPPTLLTIMPPHPAGYPIFPSCWPSPLPILLTITSSLSRGARGMLIARPSPFPLWRKSADWHNGVCARRDVNRQIARSANSLICLARVIDSRQRRVKKASLLILLNQVC